MAGSFHTLWSPNSATEFATYSTQLKIYDLQKCTSVDSIESRDLNLSHKHYGKLIASVPEVHCTPHHKTVAWQRSKENAYFFAVGESNGRVSLISLHPQDPTVNSRYHHLSPRTLGRPCNTVAWNTIDNKLLAQGLEKVRTDCSLIVWDVTRAPLSTPDKSRGSLGSSLFGKGDSHTPTDETGKCFETGNSESTYSISWFPHQPNCLVAGMGSTYLRIFDIRDTMSAKEPKTYAQNKAIYGLAVDPYAPHQLASFAKNNTVFMWDIRNFRNPVYSFQRPGNVLQLEWVPTRSGCLSLLATEAPYLRLIDIPSLPQVIEAPEEYLSHHMNDRLPLATRNPKKPVVCVEWHPEWTNTALYINNEGAVKEVNVCDKIPVTWSSHDPLIYTINGDLFTLSEEGNYGGGAQSETVDISHQMFNRVKHGYGFDVPVNIGLVEEESALHQVWSWIKDQVVVHSDNDQTTRKVDGVNSVLMPIVRGDLPSSTTHGTKLLHPTYTSKHRIAALKLCGWHFTINDNLEEFVKREEMSERFERAAAIAVFQGDIRLAITSLHDGAMSFIQRENSSSSKSDLNLIALSLAGYSAEPSLWQQTCSSIKKQINHPYLRAIFSFLCASRSPEEFKTVLNDEEVKLQDRVAIACIYLNDQNLRNYLMKTTNTVIEEGKIEGLFLTGLGQQGIELLENYVNKTGDVQSACLLAGQSHISDISKSSSSVSVWFNGYRELLDRWQLWKERAQLDHERKRRDQFHKSPRQAAVLCTFCSKAISSDVLRQDINNKSKKSTSCPSCRKPLPRCSLCLLHMVAGVSKGKEYSNGSSNQSDQFGQWFTWCQTCRHGGHATHMIEWFKSHEVCPVTDCTCHCMSLDCLI